MNGLVVLCLLGLWTGSALLLSQLRWFRRQPLVDRLRPYVPGGMAVAAGSSLLSMESFREVAAPLSRAVGERVARLFGVNEELSIRLERVHASADVTAFRLRQVGWAAAAFGGALVSSLALGIPVALGVGITFGAPLLAFLVIEQQLASDSSRRQEQLELELPVISEQLGMLLGAGYSLTSALSRLANRTNGACAEDLARVVTRIRHGLSEVEALREWSAVARVESIDRLVSVLSLNRQAGDLGRLISEEAGSMRRENQRRLIETIEKRAQQVWVPVTVATLVPGVLFLAVPFVSALRLFTT